MSDQLPMSHIYENILFISLSVYLFIWFSFCLSDTCCDTNVFYPRMFTCASSFLRFSLSFSVKYLALFFVSQWLTFPHCVYCFHLLICLCLPFSFVLSMSFYFSLSSLSKLSDLGMGFTKSYFNTSIHSEKLQYKWNKSRYWWITTLAWERTVGYWMVASIR